jgi:3-oxoacyl-[acyl-carrier protein] reductase
MSISTKVAIVTGSGQGIGRQIALTFADLGASVAVCDVNAESAKAVAAEIEAKGARALAVQANVASAEDVTGLVGEAISTFQRIDVLVNNAGITRDGLLLRMSESDWDQVLSVNLKGAFLCTQAVLRHMMKQRWGRIINIASVVGLMGNSGQANYASSKAGLIALTKTVAREVASRGITANAIAPGFIDTGMTSVLPDDVKALFLTQIPLGYIGTPEDVAHAAAFLASEESRYITGQVLNVNGGLVMA